MNQYLGELNYKGRCCDSQSELLFSYCSAMIQLTPDRLFEPAEQYLLNAGKRDSGTLLADMMFEWGGKGSQGNPGAYAARGVLP